jgi:hypothetical protein
VAGEDLGWFWTLCFAVCFGGGSLLDGIASDASELSGDETGGLVFDLGSAAAGRAEI